ncbi:MAG: glucosidase family protein [Armatimonadota bacterium]
MIDWSWLEKTAIDMVRRARIDGPEGVSFYTPSAGQAYTGLWLRDFFYMMKYCPKAFDWQDATRSLEYLLGFDPTDGTIVSMVDFSGCAQYACLGAQAEEDNGSFAVQAVSTICSNLSDEQLFAKYADRLERGMMATSLCPASGLVYVDPLSPHSAYGFCDTVDKRGHELFCSLLWWESASLLAQFFGHIENTSKSLLWQSRANRVQDHIMPAFWDEEIGLLNAATLYCRQSDIWGSAYAVAIGILGDATADRISRSLAEHYDIVVHHGQVRHTLDSCWTHTMASVKDFRHDPHGAFISKGALMPGRYQNGAYWATPIPWMTGALRRTKPDLAERLVSDCTEYFKNYGVYECINKGYAKELDYVASATNPLGAAKHLVSNTD